jgi:hypothetical protein
VDPRAGLDDEEKRKFLTLPGLELRPLDRPARSQSISRLRYLGSCPYVIKCIRYYNLKFKSINIFYLELKLSYVLKYICIYIYPFALCCFVLFSPKFLAGVRQCMFLIFMGFLP